MMRAAPELGALQGAIAGEVILPGAPGYDAARKPPLARFHDVRPQAVVRCATPSDVAATIALGRRAGVHVVARGGGHCFAGRSSTGGIVIDLAPMSAVAVADGAATVGGGARLGDVYDALDAHGLTIAAGCGPSVGIAGLTLGGGIGILGRRHGLTCDQLLAAEVVLADGRVVECDEQRHGDLFWALRGSGGGQFGVVTSLVLRTVAAPPATALHLTWPHSRAAALVEAWQSWAPAAPDELAASLLLTAGGDVGREPVVSLFGAMLGSEADTAELVDRFVAGAGARPASVALVQLPYRDVKRRLAEQGPGDDGYELGFSKSELHRRPLPAAAIAALVQHLASARRPGQSRVLDFTPLGGAYNRVRADATAFAHRDQRFSLKHDVAVAAGASAAATEAARDWLARSWAIAHPWGSGRVYPNFPDPELEDAARAYHGPNLGRLQRVKAEYDPGDVFRFPQSLRARGAA
jgi:FAD/FMN-containing dehydrogenase